MWFSFNIAILNWRRHASQFDLKSIWHIFMEQITTHLLNHLIVLFVRRVSRAIYTYTTVTNMANHCLHIDGKKCIHMWRKIHVNTFYLHINMLVWKQCKCVSPCVLQFTCISSRVLCFSLVRDQPIVLALCFFPDGETWKRISQKHICRRTIFITFIFTTHIWK